MHPGMRGAVGLVWAIGLSCGSSVGQQIPTTERVRGNGRSGDAFPLARDGTPAAVILVPEEPSTVVRFAADELKHFLDRMTGGEFAIVSASSHDGGAIVLGDCEASRAAGIDVTQVARDGYMIRTSRDRLYIAGNDGDTTKSGILYALKSSPLPAHATKGELRRKLGPVAWDFDRGTLYGVYRFLEELGVRWFFPGLKGTVIPERRVLTVPPLSVVEEPAYAFRQVGRTVWAVPRPDAKGVTHMDPSDVAAEYADLQWTAEANRLWMLRMRCSSQWVARNHRPAYAGWEARFGGDHPEYFALLASGNRDLKPVQGRTGHLCYTNEGMFRETLADIEAYVSGRHARSRGMPEHPSVKHENNRGWSPSAFYGDTFSLLPHDSYRACHCEGCRPFLREDRPHAAKHSELVWGFVDRVAREVERRFPGKKVTCLAYASFTEPPETVERLPDNVIVGLCPRKLNKTYNLLRPSSYDQLFRFAEQWGRKTRRPFFGWFHHLYRHKQPEHYGVPMLLPHFAHRWIEGLSQYADMMYVEMDRDSLMFEHLNRYVMMKLLYDPDLDVDHLLEDYVKRFYGPAARIVRDMLDDIERRCREIGARRSGRIAIWEEHFPRSILERYRAEANEAVRLTRGTRHAEAAQLFSKYFVGLMEEGHARYVRDVKEVAESREASVEIRAARGPVETDGALSEDPWARSASCHFVSNVDGQRTEWETELRLLHSSEYLYFAFTCRDPNAPGLSDREGEADSVELFLDPEHDHQSYYWIMIDNAGRVRDAYYEGGGEPPDLTWRSQIKVAVRKSRDRWVAEIALPIRSIKESEVRPAARPWGANFCRSMHHPPRPEDRYSCFSPLLRGRFHQPDLFGHILFSK